MSGFPGLVQLFDYHRAANAAALASLPDDAAAHERTYRIFGHMVNVDRVWLNRIADGEKAETPEMFPLLSKDELAARGERNAAGFTRLLADPAQGDPGREVAFITTEGKPLRSTVGGILFHVVSHGCYHRGQVAMLVGGSGGQRASTDYLLYDIGKLR